MRSHGYCFTALLIAFNLEHAAGFSRCFAPLQQFKRIRSLSRTTCDLQGPQPGQQASLPPIPFRASAKQALTLLPLGCYILPMLAGAESGQEASLTLAASTSAQALVGGMVSGAIAGAAVDIVLYPIDTIKTRLQTRNSVSLDPKLLPKLYSGLLGSLAGHVPSSALFFAVYETSKVFLLEPIFGAGAALSQLLASGAGNLAASTIRVPTEVVKTRLQSGEEDTLKECILNIVKQDGISGFFRGYPAFLLRDLPFDAIEFVTYEQLKIFLVALTHTPLSDVETALIGALAGGFTGAVTTPVDTIRARLMNEAGKSEKSYGDVWMTGMSMVQEEGVRSLFAGLVPRVLWLSLGGTVFFSTLEQAKTLFLSS
mmetsp:Transcript_1201/g.2582  ORF Transcript_1201/g.2582 Transcript_1201/m.2582 type:complete len:370 (-) Transcript_1201:81-1190(-)